MPPDLAAITARVAALRDVAASRTTAGALLGEIADALSEGYAWALQGDAWSIRAMQRMYAFIDDADTVAAGRALRALAAEHACVQRDVVALRRELAALQRHYDRLRADTILPVSYGSRPALRRAPAGRRGRPPGCGSRRRA